MQTDKPVRAMRLMHGHHSDVHRAPLDQDFTLPCPFHGTATWIPAREATNPDGSLCSFGAGKGHSLNKTYGSGSKPSQNVQTTELPRSVNLRGMSKLQRDTAW